jgi:hypothetical protein
MLDLRCPGDTHAQFGSAVLTRLIVAVVSQPGQR